MHCLSPPITPDVGSHTWVLARLTRKIPVNHAFIPRAKNPCKPCFYTQSRGLSADPLVFYIFLVLGIGMLFRYGCVYLTGLATSCTAEVTLTPPNPDGIIISGSRIRFQEPKFRGPRVFVNWFRYVSVVMHSRSPLPWSFLR